MPCVTVSPETTIFVCLARKTCSKGIPDMGAVCYYQLEREGGASNLEETEYKPKSLLPFMKRIPARRVVHLPEQAVDPLSFTLSYNSSYPLPSGIPSPVLSQYDVTGASAFSRFFCDFCDVRLL